MSVSEQELPIRIRAALDRSGKTQDELAKLAGLSQPTISGIMRGQEPRLSTYRKLDAALTKLEDEDGTAA